MSFDAHIDRHVTLNAGEAAIEAAPVIGLSGGGACIPQHYLRYDHSLESVQALLSGAAYDLHYPVFVSEDVAGQIYIQIGIIGYDNYKSKSRQKKRKIVFGRRWRVERNLPSSEILQTVFLALQKAREHELRECFTLELDGATTTPFNNHHDLPLMARQGRALACGDDTALDDDALRALIARIRYEGLGLTVDDIERTRLGPVLIALSLEGAADTLPVQNLLISAQALSANAVLHGIMDAMLRASNTHVEAHFTYNGFARFSRENGVKAIARLSLETRRAPKVLMKSQPKAARFAKSFESERYATDSTRIPALNPSPYNDALRARLAAFDLSNYAMVCR